MSLPSAVTDVVFSHHHPDHTVNAALFPAARIHDFWAVYDGDLWIPGRRRARSSARRSGCWPRPATPSRTSAPWPPPQTASTCARTPGGRAEGPADDPFSPDQAMLARSRQRILAIATVIIPGHGPSFRPGPARRADPPVRPAQPAPAARAARRQEFSRVALQRERRQAPRRDGQRDHRDHHRHHDRGARRQVRVQGVQMRDRVRHADRVLADGQHPDAADQVAEQALPRPAGTAGQRRSPGWSAPRA